MAKVEMYTKKFCPFCVRAKHLLDKLEVDYSVIPIDGDSELREHMISIAGGHTVPQILIDGQAIGGCDELYTLYSSGKLESLLNS